MQAFCFKILKCITVYGSPYPVYIPFGLMQYILKSIKIINKIKWINRYMANYDTTMSLFIISMSDFSGPAPSPTDLLGPLSEGEPYKIPEEVWEFPRDRLYIRQRIGDGLMGEVCVVDFFRMRGN